MLLARSVDLIIRATCSYTRLQHWSYGYGRSGYKQETFMLVSSVQVHHVYKLIWTPVNGQLLQVQAEAGNPHDLHAVSTVHGDTVVGHMPRDIARTALYFLQHGGRTGRRKPSDVLNKGLNRTLYIHVSWKTEYD